MSERPIRPEYFRLLNDDETAIWEAADRGTDDMNEAWRALLEKLGRELAALTCTKCGQRCERRRWRSFGEEAKWASQCCNSELPPHPNDK